VTLSLFALAALCVVNAPRARHALGPDPARTGALGATLAWAATLPGVVLAEPLADLVDISPATIRIAVGLLLVVTGVLTVGLPSPPPTPALPGRRAALVPVAFPVLFTPGLAFLGLSGSLDHSAPTAAVVLALALATVPLLGLVELPERVRRGLARFLSGALVVAGVAVLVDGVFDI
jgi:small neutral amino acid transporter SnatA (MarC family)